MKHFLAETDFDGSELPALFDVARELKRTRGTDNTTPLRNQTWAMLFFKNSTRTRISFEVGIHELGGQPIVLDRNSMQLGRGESVADTARIMSRYVHGLIIRTFEHEIIEEFAKAGSIPVVNALTDYLHPCQSFSDLFTLAERWAADGQNLFDALRGRKLAYLGDCDSNMSNSLILAANLAGMEIALSGPLEFAPGAEIRQSLDVAGFAEGYSYTEDPNAAIEDADVIYTDVWVSMGDEQEAAIRLEKMAPYQVTMDHLRNAKDKAYFMHCLPAHPGQEVTQDVLDSPRSIIFDQAENRLHMQKAILSALAATKI
jgi:ornithine carbamoyltransferase